MREQGFQNEFDDLDPLAYHIVVYDGEKPIATGRTYPKSHDGKTYAIGRIAVLRDYRGQHLGEFVVSRLEEIARQLAAEYTHLSAQIQARGFYEKLGLAGFGSIYLDECRVPILLWEKNCNFYPIDIFLIPRYDKNNLIKIGVEKMRHFSC